jgi:translin
MGVRTTPVSRSSADPSTARGRGVPEAVLLRIEAHLRQRELSRDDLYERARRLRRMAQGAMVRIHAGAAGSAETAEVARSLKEFSDRLRDEGRGDDGVARDALQESVEALLLGAVVSGTELPGPAELGVDPEPFLLGLGDLVGEVRRLVLRALTDGQLDRAEEYLALMEQLYHSLMRFDAPRAVVALKPKQDTARALLERTRGELTLAQLLARARLPPPPQEVEPR